MKLVRFGEKGSGVCVKRSRFEGVCHSVEKGFRAKILCGSCGKRSWSRCAEMSSLLDMRRGEEREGSRQERGERREARG